MLKKIIIISLLFSLIFVIIYFSVGYFTDKLSYRLGDCVRIEGYRQAKMIKFVYKIHYNNSIGLQYLTKSNKINDYDLLYDIVKSMDSEIPDKNTIVIHVRTGDIIDDLPNENIDDYLYQENKNVHNYVKPLDYYLDNLKKVKIKKLLLVTGFHTNGKKSRSKTYIERLKEELIKNGYEIDTRVAQKSADEDFLFMSNSTYFLKSGGGFSNLINEMVKRNNGVILSS